VEKLEVFISKRDGALLPQYATDASSGLDLCAFLDTPVTIRPFERVLVPTGIFISIPGGFEAQIRPRSGIANRYGVTVLNTPGTIDADYRGEIKVILINLGSEPFTIQSGDRIAQMVFAPVTRIDWKLVESLPGTERGAGGFGSTGINT
jgi:dUTP pyrophosphatase